jgi:hypothetical protein
VAFDGPTFIPEEQNEGNSNEYQPDNNTFQGIANPAKPGLTAYFGVAILAHFFLLRRS